MIRCAISCEAGRRGDTTRCLDALVRPRPDDPTYLVHRMLRQYRDCRPGHAIHDCDAALAIEPGPPD
ncbi:MAG: hypothetical protein MPI93_04400 [Nitrosopumilus sp.]|nr:hypothetical protein [Nitrosopumilus sp.]